MTKPINILDKDYTEWIKQLGTRYRRSQIKAAIKVNEEMLRFYWELGRDIVMRNAENKYGSGFMKCLSRDLKAENPDATCFSSRSDGLGSGDGIPWRDEGAVADGRAREA